MGVLWAWLATELPPAPKCRRYPSTLSSPRRYRAKPDRLPGGGDGITDGSGCSTPRSRLRSNPHALRITNRTTVLDTVDGKLGCTIAVRSNLMPPGNFHPKPGPYG